MFLLLMTGLIAKAQEKLDSINNILDGKWIWYECEPAPFDCFEEPTETHSRSVRFSAMNDDSLFYETLKNDTLIATGKFKLVDINLPTCLVMADVIFGGENALDEIFTQHALIFENDTIIHFLLGNRKSTISYKYKKDIRSSIDQVKNTSNLPFIKVAYHSMGPISIAIDRFNNSKNILFKLTNIKGIEVYQQLITDNGETNIRIEGIQTGVYFCSLYSNNYLIDTKKIVIIDK